MSSHIRPRTPWVVVDSDNEDNEKNWPKPNSPPHTSRPATPKVVRKLIEPKMADWDVPPSVEKISKSKHHHRKSIPLNSSSSIEQKPVLSGSSSSSSDSILGAHKKDKKLVPKTTESSSIPPSLSPPTPPASSNDITFNPFIMIIEDIKKFIFTPIPENFSGFVQCRLRRDKEGVQRGFSPMFYLHAERPSDNKKFLLLAAQKQAKVAGQSHYTLSTDVETLSLKSRSDGFVGKLRGNTLTGTEYTLYDNGINPKKVGNKRLNDGQELRRELAAIVYNTNILGFKGPRQISAMLPELGRDIQPNKEDDGILDQWRDRRMNYLIQLRNKTPKWNEDTKTYVLQFSGSRVTQPSVKNFQMTLENEQHEEQVVMQFGRVDDNTFTCDYRYPLSAIQAFGIALSSFDSRLARE